MSQPTAFPAVWVHSSLDALNAVRPGGYMSFLTDAQQARIERIRQGRMLFDGRHREYFLDEGRTQFDFPRVRAGGRAVQMYLTYNVLGLISLKSADLLFGQAPLLRAADADRQAALSRLVERTGLHTLLYGCAVDASYEGECFLETCARGGLAYLAQVPADEIFPDGDRTPDGQFERYLRYRVKNAGPEREPLYLLLEITYAPGRIERRCFQLDEDGGRREVGLEHWASDKGTGGRGDKGTKGQGDKRTTTQRVGDPAFVTPSPRPPVPLSPLTLTGVAHNTITWVPNGLVRGQPVSDYDGAIELQDALNAKNSQVGRVLLKHSDPRMAFPEEAFDPTTGEIHLDHDVFAYGADAERLPRYITWDAELNTAMADRAFILNQLLVRTETSQVLLGMKQGAAPDAYKKVRLEAFNSLTKASRKASYWAAGIRRAVGVAQDLEDALAGVAGRARHPVGVQLRDGIPVDDKELAERLSILKAAGLVSLERAIEEQLQDSTATEKELARLSRKE